MPKYLTVTELKKSLKAFKQDELISLICNLYKSNENARQILSVKFSDDSFKCDLLEEYKDKMYTMFFPKLLKYLPALKDIKKLITEFGNTVNEPRYIIDFTLYYVECGTEFTNTFGDINEPFYNSMCSVFGDVVNKLNHLKDASVYCHLKDRLQKLVEETSGIGWGYGDFISENYHEIIWAQEEA
jgi:hypothetical protein